MKRSELYRPDNPAWNIKASDASPSEIRSTFEKIIEARKHQPDTLNEDMKDYVAQMLEDGTMTVDEFHTWQADLIALLEPKP